MEPGEAEPRWTVIICFGMALAALIVILKLPNEMGAFLSSIGDIGPGHTDEEKMWGLLATGMVGVLIAGIVVTMARSIRDK